MAKKIKFETPRPIGRLLQEGSEGFVCEKCGSSLKRKFFFFFENACIQPMCDNYKKEKKFER